MASAERRVGGDIDVARFRVGTDDGRVGTDRVGGLAAIIYYEPAFAIAVWSQHPMVSSSLASQTEQLIATLRTILGQVSLMAQSEHNTVYLTVRSEHAQVAVMLKQAHTQVEQTIKTQHDQRIVEVETVQR